MIAPKPVLTMANVFDDDGRYLGFVFARGVAGFEAFSAADKSSAFLRPSVGPQTRSY